MRHGAKTWPWICGLVLGTALLAGGCASADLDVTRPVPIEIRKVALSIRDDTAGDMSGEDIGSLHDAVAEELESAGITVAPRGGADATRVVGTVVRFEPGMRALRYVSGYGLGTGTIVSTWAVKDSRSRDVARCTIEGSVSGGVFGGSIADVEAEIGRAVARFLGGSVK